jgi:glutamate synthase domain-containing protein 3
MSGGIAYVWDRDRQLPHTCNLGTVLLEEVETRDDILELRDLISTHRGYTGSTVPRYVLEHWDTALASSSRSSRSTTSASSRSACARRELEATVSTGFAAQ